MANRVSDLSGKKRGRAGHAGRLRQAERCRLAMRDGSRCQAPALSPKARRRYSELLMLFIPEGICAQHAKQRAARLRTVRIIWNWGGARRCRAIAKHTGLSCRLPAMKGRPTCRFHGAPGAAHGAKAWKTVRTLEGTKKVRVKRENRWEPATTPAQAPRVRADPPRSLTPLEDEFRSHHVRRGRLPPLY